MITVAVALLLFFRCILYEKVGKSSTDDDSCFQNTKDTAVVVKPVESIVNSSTMVKNKMTNGVLNRPVSGIKCSMGTGVIPSHASVESLIVNSKEYLKASVDSGKTHDDGSTTEESTPGRPIAECAALLKTPVKPYCKYY